MCRIDQRLDRLKTIMMTGVDRTVVFANSVKNASDAYEVSFILIIVKIIRLIGFSRLYLLIENSFFWKENVMCALIFVYYNWRYFTFSKENNVFCIKFLQLLRKSSVYVIYADENIPELETENISQRWNNVYSEGSHPVLGASFCFVSFKPYSHVTYAFTSTSPPKFNIALLETQMQMLRMVAILEHCVNVQVTIIVFNTASLETQTQMLRMVPILNVWCMFRC